MFTFCEMVGLCEAIRTAALGKEQTHVPVVQANPGVDECPTTHSIIKNIGFLYKNPLSHPFGHLGSPRDKKEKDVYGNVRVLEAIRRTLLVSSILCRQIVPEKKALVDNMLGILQNWISKEEMSFLDLKARDCVSASDAVANHQPVQ